MRFYGIPSEDRVFQILECISSGEWIVEDLKENAKEVLAADAVRERLRQIVLQVKSWKESLATLTQGTVFIFVHEPDNPKAFKIYDTSSLGCSTQLTPPRWKVYLKELEGSV